MNAQFCEKIKNHEIVKTLAILLGLFLATLVIAKAIEINDQLSKAENSLSVTATGEIYAKPDLALVVFSVVNEAKTVAGAMTENTEKMNAVIESVKGQGVADKDLKTTSFNVYPRYEWEEKTGKRTLAGYEVSQSLEVKIRDLAKIGEIIQEAVDQGANELISPQFIIDNEDELKNEARAQAIKKAKDKARELASQLGVRLLRIANFQENAAYPIYLRTTVEAAPMGKGGGVPDIQTGENKIEVTVSITYDIR